VGKSPTSTTTKQIPDWLASALKPLLSQSASGLAQFGAQGQNILQGHPAGAGRGPIDPTSVAGGGRGGNFKIDPGVLAAMKARVR
jgi:hypothetical protein